MKRIVFCGLSTLSATVLLFGYSTSTSGPAATAPTPTFTSSAAAGADSSETTSGSASGTAAAPPDPSATPSAAAQSSSTTVTGTVAQTRWGPVQVQLTIADSTISDVSILQYPNGNGRDVEINNVALPQLIEETLNAQSADIDMVSGATYTSEGYLQSLQSALDQAGV